MGPDKYFHFSSTLTPFVDATTWSCDAVSTDDRGCLSSIACSSSTRGLPISLRLPKMLVRREMSRRETWNVHPRGDDSARWDNPLLCGVDGGREEPPAGELADEPWDAVEEDVGAHAGDDSVCNAMGGSVRTKG